MILTRIESFRALKFSKQESFRALQFSFRILDIRVRKFLNLESFRALKLSNLYALLSPEQKFFGTHVWYGLRSKRSKEEEKREKTPVRVATTFCLCTPKGSARTPLGPNDRYQY